MQKKYLGKNKSLIFTGHRVIGGIPDNKIDLMSLLSGQSISDTELKRRLSAIKKFYKPGNPQDLVENALKDDCFYLTFDDGYADNIEYARPILDELGIKAVIFVVSHLLRNPEIEPWWDKYGEEELNNNLDERLAKNNYLTRCGNKKELTKGIVADEEKYSESSRKRYLDVNQIFDNDETFFYSNHTSTHANLRNLSDDELDNELGDCVKLIKDSPRFLPLLAYPFGSYNEKVLEKVKNMPEVNMAFATGRGSDFDPYCLKRINLNTSPYHLFYADLVGIFPFLSLFKKMINPFKK